MCDQSNSSSYYRILPSIQGVLELGFNPESTSSRDWKSRLFVLKHDPKTKRSTLDFYKDTKKRWQKQVAKGLISLWPTFRLSLAHMSSYKFPIKLVTSDGQTFCLATPDFQTMNVWYNQIQSQLTLDNLFTDKKGGVYNIIRTARQLHNMYNIVLYNVIQQLLVFGFNLQYTHHTCT